MKRMAIILAGTVVLASVGAVLLIRNTVGTWFAAGIPRGRDN